MSNTAQNKRLPIGRDISTRRRVARTRRHARLRKHMRGTAETPRLVVHRTSRHMHVQIIDDLAGHTLAAASTMEPDIRGSERDKKARAAKAITEALVETCGCSPEAVSIVFNDVTTDNWAEAGTLFSDKAK